METTIFTDEKNEQYVVLPDEMNFADNVQSVHIRQVGQEIIISPIHQAWNRFFLNENKIIDDFSRE